jgi:putative component of membrane protein insertase Oxa1/YidC/SpoIIIJ protein YidD
MKHVPRRFACAVIQRYQDRGGGLRYFAVACNFTPTCSEYTKQAIEDLGLWRGTRLGWSRIKRCQHKGLSKKIEDPYQLAGHEHV